MIVPTSENTKTVTDMRKNPVGLLRKVNRRGGPQYLFYRSAPKAVLLDLESYQNLLDLAEDFLDSLAAQEDEKENKKKVGWLSPQQLKRRLGLEN